MAARKPTGASMPSVTPGCWSGRQPLPGTHYMSGPPRESRQATCIPLSVEFRHRSAFHSLQSWRCRKTPQMGMEKLPKSRDPIASQELTPQAGLPEDASQTCLLISSLTLSKCSLQASRGHLQITGPFSSKSRSNSTGDQVDAVTPWASGK